MTKKRLALIITSYQYQDPDLRQLVAPIQDARVLAQVLENPNIGGFEVQTLLNEPSYRVNQAIETFFADHRRDDLLLLYFSGHGIKDTDGQLYFATADTQRRLLRSTAVPASFVNDVMRSSYSRRQVLLLDCCYSGAFARGMIAKADEDIHVEEHFGGHGQVVLTASSAMQYAFEGDKVEGKGVRSVFTRVMVHGLETGEADLDGDGLISFDELYEYVYDHVTDEVPQQSPRKWDFDVQGKIIIAQNPHHRRWKGHLRQMMAAYKRDDFKTTIAEAARVIKTMPDNVLAHTYQGLAYSKLGHNDQAVAAYTKAIEASPAYSYAYQVRGITYHSMGQHSQAIADYAKALEIEPNNACLWCRRGSSYKALGDYRRAIDGYTKAIELAPNCATVHKFREALYRQLGKNEDAAADFQRYLELDTDALGRKA